MRRHIGGETTEYGKRTGAQPQHQRPDVKKRNGQQQKIQVMRVVEELKVIATNIADGRGRHGQHDEPRNHACACTVAWSIPPLQQDDQTHQQAAYADDQRAPLFRCLEQRRRT